MKTGDPTHLDQFAELLSQDLSLGAIAAEMNLKGVHAANALLQRLRSDLGSQAR